MNHKKIYANNTLSLKVSNINVIMTNPSGSKIFVCRINLLTDNEEAGSSRQR